MKESEPSAVTRDGLSRRTVLKLGLVGIAGVVVGAGTTASLTRLAAKPRPQYRFFTDAEADLLIALCDQLIPGDDGPGATETSAINFIDRQLCGFYKRHRPTYRRGLESFRLTCLQKYGYTFQELDPARKIAALLDLESGRVPGELWAKPSAQAFFNLVLAHTMQSFYGSPRHGGNRGYASHRMLGLDYLRRDPLMPALLGIKRVPSQSTFTRFFQGFTSAGKNLACFRPLFAWAMAKLPRKREGYALDLDSTRLLHEDGHQDGVAIGYTRLGTKPCLHPLLAIFSEVRLVAGFWLRAGNSGCANNVEAFFLDLWANLPCQLRLRVVRADSGFYAAELLRLWEKLRVKFIVVARLTRPVQSLLRRETRWLPTGIDGTEVAELDHHETDVPATARFIALRHRLQDKSGRAGGKLLIDCPGYLYQVLVTNLPRTVPPLEVWRDYNGRAACENVIKELDAPATACPNWSARIFGPRKPH
jgi:hypothetical protein